MVWAGDYYQAALEESFFPEFTQRCLEPVKEVNTMIINDSMIQKNAQRPSHQIEYLYHLVSFVLL